MGGKNSKADSTYLPATPMKMKIHSAPEFDCTSYDNDPRSPNLNVLRTPIELNHVTTTIADANVTAHNPFGLLRKKMFRGLMHNINDPRSPSALLNRTPLIFDEAIDKTLNLNDTFADFSVETSTDELGMSSMPKSYQTNENANMHVGSIDMQVDVNANDGIIKEAQSLNDTPIVKSLDEVEGATASPIIGQLLVSDEEATMPCPAILRQTPVALQELDPRSPTIGVDRTPIIFCDDEFDDDANLENVLATLSLNLSNASSVDSFGDTPTLNFHHNSTEANGGGSNANVQKFSSHVKTHAFGIKVTNKHLERVRNVSKRHATKKLKPSHQRIYLDVENTIAQMRTPKGFKTGIDSLVIDEKRTPLSSVKNRHHFRARSVESSSKSLKTSVSITSFDDSFPFRIFP